VCANREQAYHALWRRGCETQHLIGPSRVRSDTELVDVQRVEQLEADAGQLGKKSETTA